VTRLLPWIAVALAVVACKKGSSSSSTDKGRCDQPAIAIAVDYAGASPSEVEALVVRPIEEAIAPLASELDAVATAGRGEIVLRPRGEVDRARAAILDRLGGLTGLPDDADRPLVSVVRRGGQQQLLALSGELAVSELRAVAERVRAQLLASPGVRRVTLVHAPDRELRVEVDTARLAARGVTVAEIASAIRQASTGAPSGSVRAGGGQILLRTNAAPRALDQVIVGSAGGAPIRLADVARISDAFAPSSRARLGGRPAILLSLEAARVDLADLALPPAVTVTPLTELDCGEPKRARLRVRIELPAGTDPEEVDRLVDRARKALEPAVPRGATLLAIAGGRLTDPELSPRGELLVLADEPPPDGLVAAANQLVDIVPGAAILVSGEHRIRARVRLQGDDLTQLHRAAGELGRSLARRAAIQWAAPQVESELSLQIADSGRRLGITATDLAATARAHRGQEVATFARGRDLQRVVLVADPDRDLPELTVAAPGGQQVPLTAVARIERRQAPRAIRRHDQRRVAYVDLTAPRDADLDELVERVAGELADRYPKLSIAVADR
jgi:multidrug efflux pump subunit AcrB